MAEPEELAILRVIQTQQNVGVFSDLAYEVLHVDVEIKTCDFLRLSMEFQHHLNNTKKLSHFHS